MTIRTSNKLILAGLTLLFSCNAYAKILNENNPEGYKEFRQDYAEMVDLANPNKMSFRIFYESPSEGPHSEWFDAVKKGDLEKVKEIYSTGLHIDVTDNAAMAQTALGWAAFIGYEDIVDFLLDNGASIYAQDRGDVSDALNSAALGKNVNIFKKIHAKFGDKMYDINSQVFDRQGETLLLAAAANDRQEMVKHLISLGADVNIHGTQDPWWKHHPAYDNNALSIACQSNYHDMAKILIDNGAINHKTGKPSCD